MQNLRRRLTLCLAFAVNCCGASGVGPAEFSSIEGLWNANWDGLGSTLNLTLSSKGTRVTGTGTYSVGAIRTGSVVIAGTYRPPIVNLTLTYDHGETVMFAATVTDSEHITGKLTYKNGTVINLEFVRP